MTIRQEADILYRYIVLGIPMKDIADGLDISMSVVSNLVEETGFNRDRGSRNNFQGGQDKGRYGIGKAAAKGLRINREMIQEYLEYIDDYYYTFDRYVSEVAEDIYAEEQERREREAQARRQREQEERWRREQMEKEAALRHKQAQRAEAERRRAEEERRRIEAENARIRAEQEALRKKYPGFIELARKNLKEGKMQAALDAAYNARRCSHTYETNMLIAQILAKSSNAKDHADLIIKELSQVEEWRKNNGQSLTADENLYLARAYLNKGDKNNSCDYYFYAGDYYYECKEYEKADAIYTEGIEKTNYYSSWSKNAPFRVAFSRGEKKSITKEDHKYCVYWYDIAISRGYQKKYSYGNRSWHKINLGAFEEAVEDAKNAINLGLCEKYVYNNLLNAQISNMDYDDIFETMEAMDKHGFEYPVWVKGWAIFYSSDYEDEEAYPYFKQYISIDPFHKESLRYLLIYETDDFFAAKYAITYLKIIDSSDSEYSFISEIALNRADLSKNQGLISEALVFNPDEKINREQKKREAEEQKRRIEEERKRLEEERIKKEAQRRREEELKRIYEERERALMEERKKAEAEKKRKEEEILLSILF